MEKQENKPISTKSEFYFTFYIRGLKFIRYKIDRCSAIKIIRPIDKGVPYVEFCGYVYSPNDNKKS